MLTIHRPNPYYFLSLLSLTVNFLNAFQTSHDQTATVGTTENNNTNLLHIFWLAIVVWGTSLCLCKKKKLLSIWRFYARQKQFRSSKIVNYNGRRPFIILSLPFWVLDTRNVWIMNEWMNFKCLRQLRLLSCCRWKLNSNKRKHLLLDAHAGNFTKTAPLT